MNGMTVPPTSIMNGINVQVATSMANMTVSQQQPQPQPQPPPQPQYAYYPNVPVAPQQWPTSPTAFYEHPPMVRQKLLAFLRLKLVKDLWSGF